MDKTATSVRVRLHFGEWEKRSKVFCVSMRHAPKKDDLLGLIFIGSYAKGAYLTSKLCRVMNVVQRNFGGELCVTASIKSERSNFAPSSNRRGKSLSNLIFQIEPEDCYVISV